MIEIVRIPALSDNYIWLVHEPVSGETMVVDPALAEVEEAVDTLGGLAFVLAEQIPEVGAMLRHPSGWTIEVTDGDATHVTRLRLHPPVDQTEEALADG